MAIPFAPGDGCAWSDRLYAPRRPVSAARWGEMRDATAYVSFPGLDYTPECRPAFGCGGVYRFDVSLVLRGHSPAELGACPTGGAQFSLSSFSFKITEENHDSPAICVHIVRR